MRLLWLLAVLCVAAVARGGGPTFKLPGTAVARGQLAELTIDGVGSHENPFDPAVVRLDAEVVAPSGTKRVVPGFFMTPHTATEPPEEKRVVKHMRLFFGTRHWRKGARLELLVDDMTLVDRDTGERVVLDDFEGPLRWKSQRADALDIDTQRAHGGKRCLRLLVTVGEKRGWPGAGLVLGGADWTRFDELRLWACPLAGLKRQGPGLEFYTESGRKIQTTVRAVEVAAVGEWVEFVWRLPRTRPPMEWQAAGPPRWTVRLRPQEAGEYRIRARVKDANGERSSGWQTLKVAEGQTDGYLRGSAKDRRYLAFDSGKPFFANGINLLGRDLGTYKHYLGKLAVHGGNFIRIWLSPRTMGFVAKERGPLHYEQARAARLDALLELCAAKGVYVMVCITDFREADSRNPGSYWKDSPWNAANGGAARTPEEFFTGEAARAVYRKLLRYLVARYGHSPNVLAWEFFNEVSITDGWRQIPDAVRAWHREMAEHLRSIDPQRHIITSSFAGIEDDALWEQPLMEIAQRHQYIDGEQSFVALVAEAHAKLRRHGKPVLMGEFGRRRNRHAERDHRGVSLHNGLWAATLAGGCGTAMSWWWRWIDEHGLWPQFRAVATFVEGIDWPSERFEPSERAAVSAKPDPRHGFGPVVFRPTAGGFKPAPCNQPVALRVDASGKLDAPREKLPRFLHGLRNHRDLHNPVTFHVELPTAGGFAVTIDGVSGHGGATLELKVDGTLVRREDFVDDPDETRMIEKHNGAWRVPLPAGKHTVTVENTGRDWIRVTRYQLDAGRPDPPVRVYSLRGERTVLVWVWNESHAWYQPVYDTTKVVLRDVAVSLAGLRPGRYRVRAFDPWAGKWGAERMALVAKDGKTRLAVGELSSDVAYRIERAAAR